ncbi:MAG TPA: sodium-dependent transporter [Bacteroidia bacterium]|nr:sodium-dependent transporter [Bacteroidia bacterium]HRS59684.1 sodium-dependent transporter [Bacteroidia bacterium]HRU68605.1 sodium-dependent transporter [Bacteroidia bacterium]
MQINKNERGSFTSQIGVIAAAAGSAIGLGNIWRFPYITGQNGGAAFVLIYLIIVFLIGVPVMLSELSIGRSSQRNAFGAFKVLAPGKPWYLVGLMGVVAAFVILAFYSTVAGWTLEYLVKSVTNQFSGKSGEEINQLFDEFQTNGFRPVLWQMVFMILTAAIVFAGVQNGIEKYSKILMPLLLVLVIALDIRAVTLKGAGEGLKFYLQPDFSEVTWKTVMMALGQAFFSLSVGMGCLITYGSYIQKNNNLTTIAVSTSVADLLVAFLSGLLIFPAAFAFGINPGQGPDLVFKTLPNIFLQMPGGYFFAILFFVLIAIAALTSTISVLEVVVAYSIEELNISRKPATILATVAISILGVFCTLSFSSLADFKIFHKTFFDLFDFSSANILLPVGGFLIVIFVGWFMGKNKLKEEVSSNGTFKATFFFLFRFIVRFIAPVAIALVFLNGLGVLKF